MKKRLRVGVVRCGTSGAGYARILSTMDGVDLVGVADSDTRQGRRNRCEMPTAAMGDFRQLLGLVDAVTIAVPTFMHLDVAWFSCLGALRRWSRSRWPGPWPRPSISRRWPAPWCRLQVGHIERFNPALLALGSTAGPSTSWPSGSRPTRSGQRISASSST